MGRLRRHHPGPRIVLNRIVLNRIWPAILTESDLISPTKIDDVDYEGLEPEDEYEAVEKDRHSEIDNVDGGAGSRGGQGGMRK